MMSNYRAFSLIELLVVMTIIGCLSTMAVNSYEQYIVQSRITELFAIANSQKIKLVDNSLLANNKKIIVDDIKSKFIDKVVIATLDTDPIKHVVHVVAKMKTATQSGIGLTQPKSVRDPFSIQLQGEVSDGLILWSCHVAVDYHKYVASDCKNNDLEAMSVG